MEHDRFRDDADRAVRFLVAHNNKRAAMRAHEREDIVGKFIGINENGQADAVARARGVWMGAPSQFVQHIHQPKTARVIRGEDQNADKAGFLDNIVTGAERHIGCHSFHAVEMNHHVFGGLGVQGEDPLDHQALEGGDIRAFLLVIHDVLQVVERNEEAIVPFLVGLRDEPLGEQENERGDGREEARGEREKRAGADRPAQGTRGEKKLGDVFSR